MHQEETNSTQSTLDAVVEATQGTAAELALIAEDVWQQAAAILRAIEHRRNRRAA